MDKLLASLTPEDQRAFERSFEQDLDLEEGESASLSLRRFPSMVGVVECQAECFFVASLPIGASKRTPMRINVAVKLGMDGVDVEAGLSAEESSPGPTRSIDWDNAWKALGLALAAAAGKMRTLPEHKAASEAVVLRGAAPDPGAKAPSMRI